MAVVVVAVVVVIDIFSQHSRTAKATLILYWPFTGTTDYLSLGKNYVNNARNTTIYDIRGEIDEDQLMYCSTETEGEHEALTLRGSVSTFTSKLHT